jgi:peptide deformylase
MPTGPLSIVYYPDPVLREPAASILEVDDEVRELAGAMIETMITADGIGLAAPQVGIGRRLIVVSPTGEAKDATVHLNPHVVESSKEEVEFEEGCLSFPEIRGNVIRPERVTVEFTDLEGRVFRGEADGLLARVLQHEIDHLDGILFVTKFGPADRLRARKRLRKLEEEYRVRIGGR